MWKEKEEEEEEEKEYLNNKSERECTERVGYDVLID